MKVLFIGGIADGMRKEIDTTRCDLAVIHGLEEQRYDAHHFRTATGEVTVFVAAGVADPFERLVANYRPGREVKARLRGLHAEIDAITGCGAVLNYIRATGRDEVTVIIPPMEDRE